MLFNWQHIDWPHYQFDISIISKEALLFSEILGEMSGIVSTMDSIEKQNTLIRLLISEAITTSAIEGEVLSRVDVMSSIRNNLGLNTVAEPVKDKRAKRIGALMTKVREEFELDLTEKHIKDWHAVLFESTNLNSIGEYRNSTETMKVVSGTYGKDIVHYEAPPSTKVHKEMNQFIKWYNQFEVRNDIHLAIIKTAISHLYFESIHPFEDGNGRIGRVLAEKCLSQSLGRQVLLSLSSVIEKDKNSYYAALKEGQRSLEINNWLKYFANILIESQKDAVNVVQFSLKKTKFFDVYKDKLNERQIKVVLKMFDAGIEGFEGGMTAKKYISITKSSKATATRDLQVLTKIGVLIPKGGGRNIHYELVI